MKRPLEIIASDVTDVHSSENDGICPELIVGVTARILKIHM
jgi:hypothetical protein